jgi:rare lipoprotein A
MKSKIHEYQKNNFKVVSKKLITLFLSIAIAGLAISQTMVSDKRKSSIQKDSIKKNKILVEQEIISDTLIETGKFKFYKKDAHASYYADKFNGKRTSSGRRFDNNKYTAAHKKLPFGTKVRITNEANGRSVIVEITDRGPFVRAREIDLSKRAFMEIASNKSSGAVIVTIEVLQK